MPGDDPAGRAGFGLDLGRQGFAGHDDPALAHRPAGSARGGSRAPWRGRVARHSRTYRGNSPQGRTADPGARRFRQDPARSRRRTPHVAFELDPVVYVGFQDRPHRTRAAPLSQGPSPVRRTRRERYGHARRRERCTRPESSVAPQRQHERCRSRGLRLAADLRSLDRRCIPGHPAGRRPVAALGL